MAGRSSLTSKLRRSKGCSVRLWVRAWSRSCVLNSLNCCSSGDQNDTRILDLSIYRLLVQHGGARNGKVCEIDDRDDQPLQPGDLYISDSYLDNTSTVNLDNEYDVDMDMDASENMFRVALLEWASITRRLLTSVTRFGPDYGKRFDTT